MQNIDIFTASTVKKSYACNNIHLLHAYDFFHHQSSENINVTHNVYYKYTNYGIIIACNKPFIAWFARAYDPFSLSQKISLTRSFHSLVRDIFFARENVSYGLTTHAIIYIYYTHTIFFTVEAMKISMLSTVPIINTLIMG